MGSGLSLVALSDSPSFPLLENPSIMSVGEDWLDVVLFDLIPN